MRIIVGMCGSSGVIYGVRLLERLSELPEVETHLVLTPSARLTLQAETDHDPSAVEALADEVHGFKNVGATIASGSYRTTGMIVAPCSMKTLSSIVHSHADNLLVRAADVVLKEQRRLVLMPRESPLHLGHCRLLVQAAELGAVVAPPMPAFYTRPQSLDDIVDHSVGRILDLFDLDPGTLPRWDGLGPPDPGE